MGKRLEETDNRQRQMMNFLMKAMENPQFLQQIIATRQQNLQRLDSADMKGETLHSNNDARILPAAIRHVYFCPPDHILVLTFILHQLHHARLMLIMLCP